MSLSTSLLLIAALIVLSAFFSIAEISLAAARRLRLRQMADDGDTRAQRVLEIQEKPGHYFTVVQVGLNAVAISGGIVGEGALTPQFSALFGYALKPEHAQTVGVLASFFSVTAGFIVFADLVPKRLGMLEPEALAVRVVGPMEGLLILLKPLVWLFNGAADLLLRAAGQPMQRDERITHDDLLAMTEASARAGVLAQPERQVIDNVIELDTRAVSTAMTVREQVVYFLLDDDEAMVRARVSSNAHSTYLVCDTDIDHIVGYFDAVDLLQKVFNHQPIGSVRSLQQAGLVKPVLIVPDRLTLSEVLTQFRQAHEDFAVIVNEYSRVVGIITLNDVMNTVMGGLVTSYAEDLIVQRDDRSWLIDGVTPVPDVLHALQLEALPHSDEYETLAGFLMVMLRRIPKRTDVVTWGGYQFEVVDVDSHRVDQVLVTKLQHNPSSTAGDF